MHIALRSPCSLSTKLKDRTVQYIINYCRGTLLNGCETYISTTAAQIETIALAAAIAELAGRSGKISIDTALKSPSRVHFRVARLYKPNMYAVEYLLVHIFQYK